MRFILFRAEMTPEQVDALRNIVRHVERNDYRGASQKMTLDLAFDLAVAFEDAEWPE